MYKYTTKFGDIKHEAFSSSYAHSVLPMQGIEGVILPMPTALAHMESQGLILVEWDVGGTHPSFGQLLMLGRAAHCLHALERAAEGHTALDLVMLSVRCSAQHDWHAGQTTSHTSPCRRAAGNKNCVPTWGSY